MKNGRWFRKKGLFWGGFLVALGLAWGVFSQQPSAGISKERAEFDRLLREWQPVLQQLFDMRLEFHRYGTPEERQETLRTEYARLQKVAEQKNQQLIDQAILAYLKDERANADLEYFLMFALQYFMNMDLYDDAAEMAQHLLNQKLTHNNILRVAAFASLYSNDFETAEQLGGTLKELGLMNDFDWSQSDMQYLEYWKTEWEKERALRDKERMAADLPRVVLSTTRGEIEIELFENEAPNTVANFIFLVEKGFYTNLDFHRVIRHFMAQGGGSELIKTETNLDGTLKKRGNGGPGYTIADEIHENSRRHFRGTVSMANFGPDTGGSQFFIMFQPKATLDGRHTVFGRVVRGMNVVSYFMPRDPEKIKEVPGIEMPDKILSARVVKKRNHPYSPVIKPEKGQLPPFPKMPGMEDKPGSILDDNWDVLEEIRKGLP